jgi:hypothetical protein
MDNDAAPGGQAEPSEQQADVNTSLDLSASVSAAAAFVGFQETISSIEERLDTRATSEVDSNYSSCVLKRDS